MSLPARREYLKVMHERYLKAHSRKEKSKIIEEVMATLGYHRKYAITVLRHPPGGKTKRIKRQRKQKYLDALPVIRLVWEALDYPCAERLKPMLLEMAELLASHGELTLTEELKTELSSISRSTLARRIKEWPSPKPKRALKRHDIGLKAEIPIGRLPWNETKPGAILADLVEHNGGSSLGHFAYTLSLADIVTGYSRRIAFLGRGQRTVFNALRYLLGSWPTPVHSLQTDNGAEFLNNHLATFAKQNNIRFLRSRPYKKNDNAFIEQKNRQFVREVVGYARYDTPEEVAWLNQVYSLLDPYANLFLPMRKVVEKSYAGGHLKKKFDEAKTPFRRLKESGALTPETEKLLTQQYLSLNPLKLHQQLEQLLGQGPPPTSLREVGALGLDPLVSDPLCVG